MENLRKTLLNFQNKTGANEDVIRHLIQIFKKEGVFLENQSVQEDQTSIQIKFAITNIEEKLYLKIKVLKDGKNISIEPISDNGIHFTKIISAETFEDSNFLRQVAEIYLENISRYNMIIKALAFKNKFSERKKICM